MNSKPRSVVYPESWESDVVLSDGHTAHVRPIRPEDSAQLVAFHERQSSDSVYFRFLSPRPVLTGREVRYFTELDYVDRMAFVAEVDQTLVAIARYERYSGSDTAEVAFFVDDDHYGRGLATVMLEYLAAAARHRGLRRFTASTLPNNRRMLSVFSRAGYEVRSRIEDGLVMLSFGIDPTDASTAAVRHRERSAEAATVQRLLRPGSVVVMGDLAATDSAAVVHREIHGGGFRGALGLLERPAGSSGAGASGIPAGTDLAVLVAEAPQVEPLMQECADADVGAIVLMSEGSTGLPMPDPRLESVIVGDARRYGVRVLGPDCLGLINTDPEVNLRATVSGARPEPGPIGLFAESGTLATTILAACESTALGVSSFVAGGTRLDVGASDILSFWSTDEGTRAVLLYLRSSALSPRLLRALRNVTIDKPVAMLGNMLAVNDDEPRGMQRQVDALTRQTGVISVGTAEQLLDIGRILTCQQMPRGRGVAVVGNSAGAAALAADACRSVGLHPVRRIAGAHGPGGHGPLGRDTSEGVWALQPGATAGDYRDAIDEACSDDSVASLLVLHHDGGGAGSDEIRQLVADLSTRFSAVCMTAVMADAEKAPMAVAGGGRVPVFAFPEHPALALGRLASYREWSSVNRDFSLELPMGCDIDRARGVVRGALDRAGDPRDDRAGGSADGEPGDGLGKPAGSVALSLDEQTRLLDSFAVVVAEREVVTDAASASSVARRIGWPVVLKADRRDRTNRSAASGVALDIATEADLLDTFGRMQDSLGADMFPVVVQRFIERGVDVAITVRRGGPSATIEVGLGGPATGLDEPQLGLLPMSLPDAQALVASSSVGRALTDPLDRVALVGVLQRLGHLVSQFEEISLLVADPVVASVRGAWVADVHIEVCTPPERLDVRGLA